jgi:hypothetical protein
MVPHGAVWVCRQSDTSGKVKKKDLVKAIVAKALHFVKKTDGQTWFTRSGWGANPSLMPC